MTNFVLTGFPNFIVVGEAWQTSRPRPGGEPTHIAVDFDELLSLLGASYDCPELSDCIQYTEAGAAAMCGVLSRFGFERRPDTFAELYGLLEYCDRLTALSGIGVIHQTELQAWQTRSFLLLSRQEHPYFRATELFCIGDLPGLRDWHRNPDALLQIGRAFRRAL